MTFVFICLVAVCLFAAAFAIITMCILALKEAYRREP